MGPEPELSPMDWTADQAAFTLVGNTHPFDEQREAIAGSVADWQSEASPAPEWSSVGRQEAADAVGRQEVAAAVGRREAADD